MPRTYLAALLEAETADRAERREERRLIDARFPALKRLEDFRFGDNPKIPRTTIAALAEGSWIENNESVIFVGDSYGQDSAGDHARGLCLLAGPPGQVRYLKQPDGAAELVFQVLSERHERASLIVTTN